MDPSSTTDPSASVASGYEIDPILFSAFVVLIGGWLLAIYAGNFVKRYLRSRLSDSSVQAVDSAASVPSQLQIWIPKAVALAIKTFAVVTFLHLVSQTKYLVPLSVVLDPLAAIMPKLIHAVVLLVVAGLVATGVKQLTLGALRMVKPKGNIGIEPATETALRDQIAGLAFWLVMLFFLPAIVAPFGVPDLVEPLGNILDRIFSFAPNIVATIAILFIGGFVAGILRRILEDALGRAGVDRISERWAATAGIGELKLSALLARIVYLLLLLAIGASAIDALKLETIYAPAAEMLGRIFGFIPKLLGAVSVLIFATVLGRILGSLATDLLTALGLNALWVRLGWAKQVATPGTGPAKVLGQIVFVATVLLATSEAARMVGLDVVPVILANLVINAAHILFGVGIFACGIVVARFAAEAVAKSGFSHSLMLTTLARVSILVLAGALALQAMNIANDIVTIGFSLVVGAVAVAAALAFGFGGREAAARVSERFLEKEITPPKSE